MTALESDPIIRRRKSRVARYIIAAVVVAVLGVGGYYLLKYFSAYESTDDAQVDGHINAVSGRITGNVIEVRVEDEQEVKAGDVLVRLDPLAITRSRSPKPKRTLGRRRRRWRARALIFRSSPPTPRVN